MRKFPKNWATMRNWATLAVAIVAVVASVSAMEADTKHYEEAIEADKQLLDKAIEADKQLHDKVIEADKQLHDKVIEADTKHFEESKTLLQARYDELDKQYHKYLATYKSEIELNKKHYQTLSEQFEKVTAPHIRHEEVYDHLSLLWDRLVVYRDWLGALASVHRNVVRPYYREASDNFYKAEEELRAGNFEQAMQSIETANVILTEGSKAYEEARAAVE